MASLSRLTNLPHQVATLSPLTMLDCQASSPSHLAKLTIKVHSPSWLSKFAHQVCPLGQLSRSAHQVTPTCHFKLTRHVSSPGWLPYSAFQADNSSTLTKLTLYVHSPSLPPRSTHQVIPTQSPQRVNSLSQLTKSTHPVVLPPCLGKFARYVCLPSCPTELLL